jgi:hypothetical protein
MGMDENGYLDLSSIPTYELYKKPKVRRKSVYVKVDGKVKELLDKVDLVPDGKPKWIDKYNAAISVPRRNRTDMDKYWIKRKQRFDKNIQMRINYHKKRKHTYMNTVETPEGEKIIPSFDHIEPKQKQEKQLSRKEVHSVLCGIMPPKEASEMVGYKCTKPSALPATTEAVREKFKNEEGFTLSDQLNFYKKLRDSNASKDADRIKSASKIDDLLNYNPVKKVEIGGTISHAHTAIDARKIMAELNMAPDQLKQMIDDKSNEIEATYTEVSDE